MKKLIKEIQKEKTKLINYATKKGIYENFGQKEVDKLRDAYIDISKYTDEMNQMRELIKSFDAWCMNYTG